MKMGVITVRPKTFFIAPILLLSVIIVSTQAQTAKPSSASHPQTADSAARKQLAAYMVDFRTNPEDAELRDEIIALAKTLKPAPVVPQAAQADFAKAVAQLKSAATADAFNTAAKLFEQVAAKAPWYADAYYNAASAYAKAADYGSAKRNLTLYMAAVRPGETLRMPKTCNERLTANRQCSGFSRLCRSSAQTQMTPLGNRSSSWL